MTTPAICAVCLHDQHAQCPGTVAKNDGDWWVAETREMVACVCTCRQKEEANE